MGSVGRDRAHRDIHSQLLSVSVKNSATTGGYGFAAFVLFGRDRDEVIVLKNLKMNQSPGKACENEDKQGADNADSSPYPFHLLTLRWGTPGPNRLSGSREAVRRTPSTSAGAGGVTRAIAVSRIA
jgi:hypothetical protein